MNPSILVNFLVACVLAIIGYFLLPLVTHDLTAPIALALGVFLGGMLVPVICSFFSTTNNTTDDTQPSTTIGSTLYVGNLPFRANEHAVRELFSEHGKVVSVRLMKDKRTGKRKGYGFVEMAENKPDKIIAALNDSTFQERTLKVRLAKDKIQEPAH